MQGVAAKSMYGAFGVPVALLLWINFTSKLLLYCAAWTATPSRWDPEDDGTAPADESSPVRRRRRDQVRQRPAAVDQERAAREQHQRPPVIASAIHIPPEPPPATAPATGLCDTSPSRRPDRPPPGPTASRRAARCPAPLCGRDQLADRRDLAGRLEAPVEQRARPPCRPRCALVFDGFMTVTSSTLPLRSATPVKVAPALVVLPFLTPAMPGYGVMS